MKEKQVSAKLIIRSCDFWRRQLWPVWQTELLVTTYANGGPPPSDDDCETEVVPLGFANTYMRKEQAPLLDPLTMKPGIIDAQLINPALNSPQRTQKVQSDVNLELNNVAMPRLRAMLTAAAGRATVTGRAYIFRKSPNDWVLKSGRMLHPADAGIDLQDSNFREWAFADKLSLRDIDVLIKNSNPERHGWSKSGLEKLKMWILAAEAQKYKNGGSNFGTGVDVPEWVSGGYDPMVWGAIDLDSTVSCDPVDVYWYFRKNGEVTKNDPNYGGHEGVDLYCVSRFGSQSAVMTKMRESCNMKELGISYKDNDFKTWDEEYRKKNALDTDKKCEAEDNERLLFYKPGVFKSIDDCLILHVDDAAISGDQKLGDIQGTGKTAMPKLAVMEALLTAMIEGLTFGAQINWTVQPGIGDEYMKQLQRGGLMSGQAFPPQISPMMKNNAFTGFGPAMSAIRMLDTGISADSSASNQGNFGGSQQEFAAQAQAELAGRAATAGRRMENWLLTLDRVAQLVGRTLCRHWPTMKEAWPAYQDAARMRLCLVTRYKVHEDEWDADRWVYQARRLAGAMMKQESLMKNMQVIEVVGPIIPQVRNFAAREILRVVYGDTTADQLMNPSEEEKVSQTQAAGMAVAAAYVTGQAPIPQPQDDPVEHSRVASTVAKNRIQAAGMAGTITMAESAGINAILAYAVAQVQRLDEEMAKPAMLEFAKMGKALNSIPVQQPPQEGAMTEKEMAEIQLKQGNQQRLISEADRKAQLAEQKTMIEMKKLGNAEAMQEEQKKTLATQRAQATLGMAQELNAADEPTEIDIFAPA